MDQRTESASPTEGPGSSYERASATFSARHLHALEPIIRASQDNIDCAFTVAGLMIEPVETGGAVLVATDGRVLAAIFDATAHATRALRLHAPDALFAAVTPPASVQMYDQGDTFEMPLPEWAQPGQVLAWGLAAYVFGQMQHPHFDEEEGGMLASVSAERGKSLCGGYRIHAELPTIAWRSILTKPRSAPSGRVNLYPQMLARFDRIERLFEEGIEVSLGGEGEPAILTIPGKSEFIGAMMPNRVPIEAPDLPVWASNSLTEDTRP